MIRPTTKRSRDFCPLPPPPYHTLSLPDLHALPLDPLLWLSSALSVTYPTPSSPSNPFPHPSTGIKSINPTPRHLHHQWRTAMARLLLLSASSVGRGYHRLVCPNTSTHNTYVNNRADTASSTVSLPLSRDLSRHAVRRSADFSPISWLCVAASPCCLTQRSVQVPTPS